MPTTPSTTQPHPVLTPRTASVDPRRIDGAEGAEFAQVFDASALVLESYQEPSIVVKHEQARAANRERTEAGVVRGRGGETDAAAQAKGDGAASGREGSGAGRRSVEGENAARGSKGRSGVDGDGEAARGELGATRAGEPSGTATSDAGPATDAADGADASQVAGSVAGAAAVSVSAAPAATVASVSAASGAVRAVEGSSPANSLLARLEPSGRQSMAAKASVKPEQPAGTKGGDEAARAQLVRGLASLVRTKGGTVTLELDQAALGRVRVDVGLREGVVSARFVAQTEEARGLLERSIASLRGVLEDRGLVVQRLEVVSESSAGGGREPAWNAGGHGGAGDGAAGGGAEDRARSQPQGRGDERDRPRDAADDPDHDLSAEREKNDVGVETLGLDTVA